MLSWAVWIALVAFWIMSAGLLAAAGLALRAVLRRRLVLGSRLFLWREPERVVEGGEAVRVSLYLLVFILSLGFLCLAMAIKLTSEVWLD